MKLYLLQGLLQETNELHTYEVFYKKPTIKDIFEALTGESYDSLSEEEIKESLGYMDLTLLDIVIGLLQTNSIITNSHIYYLYSLELNNKEILANMDEEIKVLLCNDTANSSIICAVIGNPTEDSIPKNDLNHMKNYYESNYYSSAKEALEDLFNSNVNKLITNDDLLYEWDKINTKDIK